MRHNDARLEAIKQVKEKNHTAFQEKIVEDVSFMYSFFLMIFSTLFIRVMHRDVTASSQNASRNIVNVSMLGRSVVPYANANPAQTTKDQG